MAVCLPDTHEALGSVPSTGGWREHIIVKSLSSVIEILEGKKEKMSLMTGTKVVIADFSSEMM